MTEPLDMDVQIEVRGKSISVEELLSIDETDMSNEFATQAARYAFFAVMDAEAEHLYLKASQFRKETEAEAFADYKADMSLVPPGSKSVTDGFANQLVQLDATCVNARLDELDARRKHRLMKAISYAFHMRADMLRSLGTSLRHEEDMTGMSVKTSPSDGLRNELRKRIAG